MCLGVPMRVTEIEGFTASCEARGSHRQVSLFLIQHEAIRPGDLVMVHQGHALSKMAEEEARAVWALYDEMLQREREAATDPEPVNLTRRTQRA